MGGPLRFHSLRENLSVQRGAMYNTCSIYMMDIHWLRKEVVISTRETYTIFDMLKPFPSSQISNKHG